MFPFPLLLVFCFLLLTRSAVQAYPSPPILQTVSSLRKRLNQTNHLASPSLTLPLPKGRNK
ncbi:hypothetical protein DL95DRAFT_387028 [Leptodontidium sp. 2 PMI_412]|nr:hypothetical protein DL95DRAFT_387028 [Leptodontidium sp. 2 PMI_412]